MKKLISLTLCATFVLSSLLLVVDTSASKFSTIDVVSAASEAVKVETKAPAKTTTPSKTTQPSKSTTKESTTKETTKTPAIPEPTKDTVVAEPVKAAEPTYADGVYVTYGNAYSKGTEGAKVTIKVGKVAAIELLRTSPKLIDRDARYNYSSLWNGYEVMKARLVGTTREEAAQVDVVSGATRSSDGWKLSVDRAFSRALVEKPADEIYFEGEHMGVDPQGKFMVFVNYDKTKRLGVKVYPLNEKGDVIDEASMSAEQAKMVYTLAGEILYRGVNAVALNGYEAETKAVVNAFRDAELNAKVNNTVEYIDGVYSAYGSARDKGVERADVVIRNGKLVDVKLYRLGSNLIDRGDTAYADVVKANAPMVEKLLKNGSYIKDFDNSVDAISGATESSHSWNLAVERAFEKARKVPTGNQYFEGTFAGVDNKSRVLVLVDVAADKVTKTAVSLFGADGKLIAEDKLTEDQKAAVAKLNEGLTKDGAKTEIILGQEVVSLAAKAAFTDAMLNASVKQSNYKDGKFTAYGDASNVGTNRADVTLRNGNIVGIELYRVGNNLVDKGASAYADLVKGLPQMLKDFLNAGTREQAQKIDVISGATSSSNAFKQAVDRVYKKAEIVEPYKAAYLNGIHAGVNADKSVYVMVTVEHNVPVKMEVSFLDAAGKVKAADKLSADEKAVKAEIETPMTDKDTMHKYAYRPAAFGDTESLKALSAKAIDAVKVALEIAGR